MITLQKRSCFDKASKKGQFTNPYNRLHTENPFKRRAELGPLLKSDLFVGEKVFKLCKFQGLFGGKLNKFENFAIQ